MEQNNYRYSATSQTQRKSVNFLLHSQMTETHIAPRNRSPMTSFKFVNQCLAKIISSKLIHSGYIEFQPSALSRRLDLQNKISLTRLLLYCYRMVLFVGFIECILEAVILYEFPFLSMHEANQIMRLTWSIYSAHISLETITSTIYGLTYKIGPKIPFYWHGLTLIPAWRINYMSSKVWDGITYPFPNFSGCTVEFWD